MILWLILRLHWRFSTILETSRKSVWSSVFWYVKVCIFWICIQYTIHWDKTQILKKFLTDKINEKKCPLFFFFGAPTYGSFTFNLPSLYELKQEVLLSKTVCGNFHFDSVSFLWKFIFLFNQMHELFDFKVS